MLNRYFISAAFAAVVAGLVAALAYGVVGPGLAVLDGPSAPAQSGTAHPDSPLERRWSPLSVNQYGGPDLQMAPMAALDKTQIENDRAAQAKTASSHERPAQNAPKLKPTVQVPPIQQPLDLSLPSLGLPLVADGPAASQPPAEAANETAARPSQTDQAALDLNAGLGRSGFADDRPHKLFNRNNGLRGFMKQSWVNQNLGFQGGVAIKPERLREKDSELRDNMAVGMGVLLAF